MKFKALLVAILLISVLSVSGTALAMTEQERQTLIAQLQAQIAQLQAQIAQIIAQQQATPQDWCYTFNTNLGFSNSGSSDVGQLHTALTKQGISFSPDTGNIYSNGTATAVSIFQERYASEILRQHGRTTGTGFFGNSTRAKINQLYGCNTITPVVCTQDARQCADGSWVSRVPPSCNFAPCPTETTQTCTENNWIYNLSPETCPTSGQQTKIWTKIGTCTGGVSKPSYEVVSCSYQSNTCTSFNYSNWSACSSSGIQTRTVTSSYPSGCTGGNPETSRACTQTTSCIPDWQCSSWSSCVNGQRTKTCTDYNYCGTTTNRPALTESCSVSTPTVNIKANNSDGSISVAYNSSVNIVWTSQNVSSCTVSGDWSGSKSTSGSETKSSLTSGKTYTITCTGSAGTATDTVQINVTQPAPTVNIKANNSEGPLVVGNDSSVILSWTSQNATSCMASGSWSGTKQLNGSESSSKITSAQTFTITCTGLGGTVSDSVIISSTNEVMVSIKANNMSSSVSVDNYSSVVLSWTSQNANSCTASGDWSGSKFTYGNQTLTKYQNTTDSVWERVYTITCAGSAGTATDTVRVNVNPYPKTPTVDLKINNLDSLSLIQSSDLNAQFILSWSSSSATYCSASYSGISGLNSWSGSKELIGYQNMNITLPRDSSSYCRKIGFTITCSGPGGKATDTATINYSPKIPESSSVYGNVTVSEEYNYIYNYTGKTKVYKVRFFWDLDTDLFAYIIDQNKNKIKPIGRSRYGVYENIIDFTQFVNGYPTMPNGTYQVGFYFFDSCTGGEIFAGSSNWFSISSIPGQY